MPSAIPLRSCEPIQNCHAVLREIPLASMRNAPADPTGIAARALSNRARGNSPHDGGGAGLKPSPKHLLVLIVIRTTMTRKSSKPSRRSQRRDGVYRERLLRPSGLERRPRCRRWCGKDANPPPVFRRSKGVPLRWEASRAFVGLNWWATWWVIGQTALPFLGPLCASRRVCGWCGGYRRTRIRRPAVCFKGAPMTEIVAYRDNGKKGG